MFGLKAKVKDWSNWLDILLGQIAEPQPPVLVHRPPVRPAPGPVLPPPPGPVVTPPPGPGVITNPPDMLAQTNETRRMYGRDPLVYDGRLAMAAARIAADNARTGRLSHKAADGTWPQARADAAGYRGAVSENGFSAPAWPSGWAPPPDWGTAEQAVDGWLLSTVGHRENLLGIWSALGAARSVAGNGTTYWFCLYGRASRS